jgi:Secretion system C-terminal sorting domain
MKKLVGALLSLTLCGSAIATTVNGKFVAVTNDGLTYSVKVQLNVDVEAGMGGATLAFTFNDADLAFSGTPTAGIDYSFFAFSGVNYSVATVTKPLGNKLSINIEYNGSAGAGTPVVAGTPGGGPWTDVVTINFTTVNAEGSSDLTWVTKEVTADDQTTLWTVGAFADYSDVPLPIQLSSFTGKMLNYQGGVRLDWSTVSEVNNYGFYVQRKGEKESEFSDVPESFVRGNGTTAKPQTYFYVDNSITKPGRYSYRLRQVDLDGSNHYSSGVSIDVLVTSVRELAPIEFALLQNYPNPFNPETMIKFSVEATGPATLRLYNAIGQEVATLFDDVAEAGTYYRIRLNSSQLASGVYFYRLESGKKRDVKKLMLMK